VHLAAHRLAPEAAGTRFELRVDGERELAAFLPMHGRHNVANALAALAVAEARGVPLPEAAAALPGYRGVRRRLEVRGEAGGVVVVDDFAHHPTAVRETLAALRARFPGRRLVAAFEPRSNTSRRAVFQEEYARSFGDAAHVVVSVVPPAPLYSAFGDVPELLSADRLAAALAARGIPARALDGVDAIVEHLAAVCGPGDVVVTLSNGGFGGIWEKLLARLGAMDAGAAAAAAVAGAVGDARTPGEET
jgi:UDP-N-acetylmuramate: L-alanyl-gamma-D-glutamyl-meso-diaminopimelate ligase